MVELVHALGEALARLLLGLDHGREPLRHGVEGPAHHRDLVGPVHFRARGQVAGAHELGGPDHLAQPSDDEQVADDRRHPERHRAHQPQRQQVAEQRAVGLGERHRAGDPHGDVQPVGGRNAAHRGEGEQAGVAAVERLHRDLGLALLRPDGLSHLRLRYGLAHQTLRFRVSGEDDAAGVGDHERGVERQARALGELVDRAEVQARKEHRAHLAGGPQRGPGEDEGGAAGDGLHHVARHHEVVGGARAEEIGLVRHVDGGPQGHGTTGDIPGGIGRAQVHVDREAIAEIGEQGAAGAGLARRGGGDLGESDEQGARALDQPLLVRRGHPGETQSTLLRVNRRELALLPGRDEDEHERRQERQEHQQEQPRAEARPEYPGHLRHRALFSHEGGIDASTRRGPPELRGPYGILAIAREPNEPHP